jgi:hypothetical protein
MVSSVHRKRPWVETLEDNNLVHPADALAAALDRAVGLLATLVDLYDTRHEAFAGGNPFVVHALSTTGGLMADARTALNDLHYSCDLTLLDTPEADHAFHEDMEEANPAHEPEPVAEPEPEPYVEREVAAQAIPMPAPAPRTQEEAYAQPRAAAVASLEEAPDHRQEQFAQSYLELLRKLTAAEVFAAEQQALSAPGSAPELLPLLRGLREEFQKMHSVG